MLEPKPQIDGAFFMRRAICGSPLHRQRLNCHNRQNTTAASGNLAAGSANCCWVSSQASS